MKKITAASIVREMAGKGSVVFNDKLGGYYDRSIKVLGWTEADYIKAKKRINEANVGGYAFVRHYLSRKRYMRGKQVCRLWVFADSQI